MDMATDVVKALAGTFINYNKEVYKSETWLVRLYSFIHISILKWYRIEAKRRNSIIEYSWLDKEIEENWIYVYNFRWFYINDNEIY
jgi:hypothetical protein